MVSWERDVQVGDVTLRVREGSEGDKAAERLLPANPEGAAAGFADDFDMSGALANPVNGTGPGGRIRAAPKPCSPTGGKR